MDRLIKQGDSKRTRDPAVARTVLIKPVIILIAAGLFILAGSVFLLMERTEHRNKITLLQEELEVLQEENNQLEKELHGLERELESLQAEKDLIKEEIWDEEEVFELQGLVEVRDLDPDLEVELKYATEDNFTGRRLYPVEVCLLRRETAEKLAAANAEFVAGGYRLKIWDAYRPLSVQEVLWEHKPDPVYVADPETGSNHNRGAAVDVTLVDEEGREIKMPTGFDVFTEEASRSYPDMPREARENMDYLTEVMIRHGFTPIESEWWHFNDTILAAYDLIDLDLEDFVAEYFSRRGE